MKIESARVIVKADQKKVAAFLRDSQNLIHLLPKDQFSDWKSTETECSFKVQGGVTISLIQNGSEDDVKIFMKSGEKSPFPFTLTLNLEAQDTSTEGYIVFDGDLNVFLRMMVEKPLTALFNIMSENLKAHFD
jgi:carbon monoxide dehydrogenase subunit G